MRPYLVTACNVNEAFMLGRQLFDGSTLLREVSPRGERRLELPMPCITTYLEPRERVLFHPVRDANPFFHLMESLWIIAGRNDVEWPAQWLPPLRKYSDNGKTFHGAYGGRLMVSNQLQSLIDRLHAEPDSTRCVLGIWQPELDADYKGGDMPCNTTIYFQLRYDRLRSHQRLDMTVCNRSNDMIWGAYGANAVQWSMLQEYVAGCLSTDVGVYVQMSNNMHIYPDNEATKRCMQINEAAVYDPYEDGTVAPFPLMQDNVTVWNDDLEIFMRQTAPANPHIDPSEFHEPFFQYVAAPLASAHYAYRDNDLKMALQLASYCRATDWRMAAMEWLQRRIDRRGQKEEV